MTIQTKKSHQDCSNMAQHCHILPNLMPHVQIRRLTSNFDIINDSHHKVLPEYHSNIAICFLLQVFYWSGSFSHIPTVYPHNPLFLAQYFTSLPYQNPEGFCHSSPIAGKQRLDIWQTKPLQKNQNLQNLCGYRTPKRVDSDTVDNGYVNIYH